MYGLAEKQRPISLKVDNLIKKTARMEAIKGGGAEEGIRLQLFIAVMESVTSKTNRRGTILLFCEFMLGSSPKKYSNGLI